MTQHYSVSVENVHFRPTLTLRPAMVACAARVPSLPGIRTADRPQCMGSFWAPTEDETHRKKALVAFGQIGRGGRSIRTNRPTAVCSGVANGALPASRVARNQTRKRTSSGKN